MIIADSGEFVDQRFWSKVIKGPAESDCWIWVGSVADDGYGRYWTARDGKQVVVRPQRFLYEKLHQVILPSTTLLLHRCDVSLCVRAEPGEHGHLRPGTHGENRADRSGRREKFAGHKIARGLQTAARPADIAQQIRHDVLSHGYDGGRIRAIANGLNPDDPRLF